MYYYNQITDKYHCSKRLLRNNYDYISGDFEDIVTAAEKIGKSDVFKDKFHIEFFNSFLNEIKGPYLEETPVSFSKDTMDKLQSMVSDISKVYIDLWYEKDGNKYGIPNDCLEDYQKDENIHFFLRSINVFLGTMNSMMYIGISPRYISDFLDKEYDKE